MSLSHLRSLLFTIPAASLVTVVLILISLLYPRPVWLSRLARLWGRVVLGIAGARIRVEGGEGIGPDASFVVVSNHASLMDTAVLVGYLPMWPRFLAKQELLKVPIFGWYVKGAGHLTIDRGSVRSTLASMGVAARLIRERGISVLVFPEGTRSNDGKLQPFRDGAAFLALQAGVPLLPVAIVGADRVLPARSSHFRPGPIGVRIGAPVPVDGLTVKDRKPLTEELERRVRALLESGRAEPA